MEVCNFMKKLRERLSNKKGFTLVELIVVIVIILILAAVLIPNVMRYIDSARKSAFQSEASGYLTEITGYEAEWFATETEDLANGSVSATALPGSDMKLTGWESSDVLTIKNSNTEEKLLTGVGAADTKTISVNVYRGAVISFAYSDGTYYVTWTQSGGWDKVNDKAAGD